MKQKVDNYMRGKDCRLRSLSFFIKLHDRIHSSGANIEYRVTSSGYQLHSPSYFP